MKLHVLNASSRTDTGITEALAKSLAWLKGPLLPEIVCLTLTDGPNGISTARDSDAAAPAVIRHIETDTDADGFVVACFSDPGVFAARGVTDKPVIGIGEAGFAAAMALGDRIGTISVSKGGGKKLARQVRHLGLTLRHGAHRDLGIDYGDLQRPEKVADALISCGREMIAEEGVDVILLAGAGMAHYVPMMQASLGGPVVDPTQAAVAMAIAQIMQSAGGRV